VIRLPPDGPRIPVPLVYGVDFEITLNGEPIPDVLAASSNSDDRGCFGWIETPSGVLFGCVEFRPLRREQ
jgi:hypothetical protein